MSKSKPDFTDELISAYLDGELSDEERRHVEQVMEREPRYRQMFDELSALRESLQTLPRFQLDKKFHERVLDRALEEVEPSKRPPPTMPSTRDAPWRKFIWAGAAIAAAVLIMVMAAPPIQTPMASRDERTETRARTNASGFEAINEKAIKEGMRRKSEAGSVDGVAANQAEALPAPESDALESAPSSFGRSEDKFVAPRPQAQIVDDRPSLRARGAVTGGTSEPIADAAAPVEPTTDLDVDAVVFFVHAQPSSTAAPFSVQKRLVEADSQAAPLEYVLAEGSPDQIALSLRQMNSQAAEQVGATALGGGGYGLVTADDFAVDRQQSLSLQQPRKDASDEDFASENDLYVDLDAEESSPELAAKLRRVGTESDDGQRFSRLLRLAQSDSTRGLGREAKSGAAEETDEPAADDGIAPSGADNMITNWSWAAKTPAIVVPIEQATAEATGFAGAVVQPTTQPDESQQVRFFQLQRAKTSGREAIQGTLVDTLRQIQAGEPGVREMRVLFVLPRANEANASEED